MAEIKPEIETFAKIKVVGVGGSGNSSTNRMIASKIRGVEFVAMNTDVQALHYSQAQSKLHLGKTVTRGLGAGMDPEMGLRAAEEAQNEIREMLKGADMVFITCGLGGGTGSGASPYIAQIAKELGALTVAVVTKPFGFEGAKRKAIADGSYEKLIEQVDTIITIPNDRILQIIDRKTTLIEAFEIADDVLRQGVQGISELITVPGLINVDFADVRRIMSNRGSALMGIGRGHGENRATDAAKQAIASPLLEVSIDGARGILFTITGGSNMAMQEVSEAAKIITQSADPQAEVIFGAIIDEAMKDEVKITVIATGFEDGRMAPAKSSAPQKVTFSTPNQPVTPSVPATTSHPVSQPAPVVQPVSQVQFRATAAPVQPKHDSSYNPPIEPIEKVERMPIQSKPVQATAPANVGFPPARRQPEPEVASDADEDDEDSSKNSQPAANQPHLKRPVYSESRPTPPTPPPTNTKPSNSNEDDLEIPAFIRKKMM